MKQGRGSRPDSCIEQGRAFVNPAPVAELDRHFGLVQLWDRSDRRIRTQLGSRWFTADDDANAAWRCCAAGYLQHNVEGVTTDDGVYRPYTADKHVLARSNFDTTSHRPSTSMDTPSSGEQPASSATCDRGDLPPQYNHTIANLVTLWSLQSCCVHYIWYKLNSDHVAFVVYKLGATGERKQELIRRWDSERELL